MRMASPCQGCMWAGLCGGNWGVSGVGALAEAALQWGRLWWGRLGEGRPLYSSAGFGAVSGLWPHAPNTATPPDPEVSPPDWQQPPWHSPQNLSATSKPTNSPKTRGTP